MPGPELNNSGNYKLYFNDRNKFTTYISFLLHNKTVDIIHLNDDTRMSSDKCFFLLLVQTDINCLISLIDNLTLNLINNSVAMHYPTDKYNLHIYSDIYTFN